MLHRPPIPRFFVMVAARPNEITTKTFSSLFSYRNLYATRNLIDDRCCSAFLAVSPASWDFAERCNTLVACSWQHEHVTSVLKQFHLLPVRQHVGFKLAVLVYSALNGLSARYLADCTVPVYHNHRLVTTTSIVRGSKNSHKFGRSIIHCCWNNLPLHWHWNLPSWSFASRWIGTVLLRTAVPVA